ncbi:hypothetical protein GCM10010862_22360 [Devosia nitrariae]|uniref:Uncharacterized protein n=1 Tax=Devosia nitrariae TaxID=2071872 RepID=A0ABQ5W4J9_9HYPH|nr:hypothetical protein GCM10010862_22360 [Devosia nitrariae]
MSLSPRVRMLTVLALCLTAGPALADPDRGPDKIPPGHMPSSGECRNWIPGVPSGQQKAPTDCYTAYRDTYYNGGWLVYGEEKDRDERRW